MKGEDNAGQVLTAINRASGAGQLRIDDYAIATKDPDGKVEIKDRIDRGVRIGAVAGGAAGLLLGAIFAHADGAIIGTSAKIDGDITQPVDVDRVRALRTAIDKVIAGR